jgi:hypothetical protein
MVCIGRAPHAHSQVGKHRPHHVALGGVSFVHLMSDVPTKCSEVISEVVGEMVCFSRRVVVELYVDDVVCVLVGHLNDSNHVICWCAHKFDTFLICSDRTYPNNAFCSPSE